MRKKRAPLSSLQKQIIKVKTTLSRKGKFSSEKAVENYKEALLHAVHLKLMSKSKYGALLNLARAAGRLRLLVEPRYPNYLKHYPCYPCGVCQCGCGLGEEYFRQEREIRYEERCKIIFKRNIAGWVEEKRLPPELEEAAFQHKLICRSGKYRDKMCNHFPEDIAKGALPKEGVPLTHMNEVLDWT